MAVPSSIADINVTPSLNPPAGTERVFPDLDNHLRTVYAFIKQVSEGGGLATTIQQSLAKTGDVKPSFLRTNHDGWLLLDGSIITVADFSALVSATYVGNTLNATADFFYRATSNSNPSGNRSISGIYYVLPDMRGRFPRGFDGITTLDPTRQWGSYQASSIIAHSHTGTTDSSGTQNHSGVLIPRNQQGRQTVTGELAPLNLGDTQTLPNDAHAHTFTTNNTGGNDTYPANAVMNFFVKT